MAAIIVIVRVTAAIIIVVVVAAVVVVIPAFGEAEGTVDREGGRVDGDCVGRLEGHGYQEGDSDQEDGLARGHFGGVVDIRTVG
jgi:hypothetical protein